MTTIGERINAVRRSPEVNMTLENFGRKIRFSKGAVSAMESGARNVTEQTIRAICREFRVNETWLRTGEGPMFVEQTDQERIKAWVDNALADTSESYKVRLVAALTQLDEAGWEALYKLGVSMVANVKTSQEAEAQEAVLWPDPEPEPDNLEAMEACGQISHEEAETLRTMRLEQESKGRLSHSQKEFGSTG